MKTLCFIIASALTSLVALAQGTVNFASNGVQIYYDPTHVGPPQTPAPVGSMTVGLYYAFAGTTDPLALTLIKTTGIGPVAGRFLGGTVTTPPTTAPGTPAVFEIRIWTGGFSSYEAAVASGDPNVWIGNSGLFTNPTGNPFSVPPGTPAALTFPNFGPVAIPEPSTLVLFLSGAAAVLLQRRRRTT